MSEFIIRNATIADVTFLADTIIEGEKSGTDKLSYSTIFGISEEEARNYLIKMLLEEVDGCELSITSFVVAEKNGRVVAALSAWIEGIEGISSAVLKGNLLMHVLPKTCFEKALMVNPIINEIHIDYLWNTIQVGACYVINEFRGNKLLSKLNNIALEYLSKQKMDVSEVYVQIFNNNTSSMKAFEKVGYKMVLVKESKNKEILKYLPSNKKILYTYKLKK